MLVFNNVTLHGLNSIDYYITRYLSKFSSKDLMKFFEENNLERYSY